MTDRLPWEKGSRPQHFVARLPEGLAEIWYRSTGTEGTAGWQYRLSCGETVDSQTCSSKQDAADMATAAWPDVQRREAVRVAKIEEQQALAESLAAAHLAGRVDVMAFNLQAASYARLIEINDIMHRRRWLDGPLKPLAAAVSEELYRRRLGGRLV